MEKKRIVILGGGFGGVLTAQGLERMLRRDEADVHLISQDNSFLFQPMLPEVVGGAIEERHILNPLRQLAPRSMVTIGRVAQIDLEQRRVTILREHHVERDEIPYDYLVIAVGSVGNLSEVNGVAQHGFTLRTADDALCIRNHVIEMLEQADAEDDPEVRRQLLTFVVAGGGFSGVETIAELRDLVRGAVKHYRRVDPSEIRLVLLHATDRLLPELGPELAAFAHRSLERSGIEIRLNTFLAGAKETAALIDDATGIPTRTLIVTVGTAPNPLLADLPVQKDPRGRIVVNANLEVEGWPGVWALGDAAAIPIHGTDRLAPPTAQFAVREGELVAKNIAAVLKGREPQPFRYGGLGQFVSLGHQNAVVETRWGIKISGFAAWWMWRTYYLSQLPSLARKARVALDWTVDLLFGRDITHLQLPRGPRIRKAHYEAGDAIVRQGERAGEFFVIAEGEVEVLREGPNGREVPVARLGKGEYFGEMGLLNGTEHRTATVRAVTPVNLLTLGRDEFRLLTGSWVSLHEELIETARARSN